MDELTPHHPHNPHNSHETINLQIENLWRESRRHHHFIFGNESNQGLFTRMVTLENTIKALTEDIHARRQNSLLLIITLLATIAGNLTTGLLIWLN